MIHSTSGVLIVAALLSLSAGAAASDLAERLRALDTGVAVRGPVRQQPLAGMLAREHAARMRAANAADRAAWAEVRDKASWERFRSPRLAALRESLGTYPDSSKDLMINTTRALDGDGYRIENVVIETRPGLLMPANLYRPAKPAPSMPGILIATSHQQPKHNGWRQDMAMTWARAGCVVIVPDHIGHGERKQHPFPDSHPHDYHFRFDSAIQLDTVGDSLMGWLVWDQMRAVDVLLKQRGVDPKRIVAVSEPAGGGDVAAVTAALDSRITTVVVNNFGGPQPETAYPLPPDAEISFEYAGSGSWESTRCLRNSARDGFLPWFIVASIAPRRVVYYHEFFWDREHDPVWKRLQTVWSFYGAADNLAGLAGRGFVAGEVPFNSHWIAESREILYPQFEKWLHIPNPGKEYSQRRPEKELMCITPEIAKNHHPAYELVARLGEERGTLARDRLVRLSAADLREGLRRDWAKLLGSVEPGKPAINGGPSPIEMLGNVHVERLHLVTKPGILVPTLLLVPKSAQRGIPPVVVGLSQQGKDQFLKRRASEIASLLEAGVAVCLPDARGTGETAPADGRDRRSAATAIAAGERMLGRSMLGGRLRDLRSVLAYLRTRSDVDTQRIALWGESFASVNAPDTNLKVPYTGAIRPALAEPLGALLAMLGGLYEENVRSVVARGGLSDYRSLLDGPFTYVPFDAIVPGVLSSTGDLQALAAGLAPRPLRIESTVDGTNQRVAADHLIRKYATVLDAYKGTTASRLLLEPIKAPPVADWLANTLRNESPKP